MKITILGSSGQIGAYLSEYLSRKGHIVREFDIVNGGHQDMTIIPNPYLENAIEESKTLGFPYVGPEHILLAILMEQSGIAVTALQKILRDVNPDINFDIIRKRTLREMGEEFEVELEKKGTSWQVRIKDKEFLIKV